MKPTYIKARNLGSFPTLDLPLPEGPVSIVGENGAGKSTLADSTVWGLFGPDGPWSAGYLTDGVAATDLELEVGFTHSGGEYRVRRGYSSRGSGKTVLDLERRNGAGWVPLTRESQKATQELIEEITGLSRETLLASSVIRQDARGWASFPPAKRKDVIGGAIGLRRFDRLLGFVKDDRKAADTEAAKIAGAIERADAELAEKDTVVEMVALARNDVTAAQLDVGKLTQTLEAAAAEVAAMEQRRVAVAEAEAAVLHAEAALRPLIERGEKAAQATRELAEVGIELGKLATAQDREVIEQEVATLEAELAAYQLAVAEVAEAKRDAAAKSAQRDAILAQAESKRSEAAKLDEQAGALDAGDLSSCPTCEQDLGADARAATLANLRARATVLDDERRALAEQAVGIEIPAIPAAPEPPLETQERLTAARQSVERARGQELHRERLNARVEILRESVAAAPVETEVAAAHAQANAAASTLEQLPAFDQAAYDTARSAAVTAKTRLDIEQARLDAARAGEARAAAALERLDKLEHDTAADRAHRETLLRKIDLLAVMETAYGCSCPACKKARGAGGIPAWIVESVAIPFLETEANKLLGELGGKTASSRIELRSERTLKSGAVATELDIVVAIDGDVERAYERFSGGEKTRLDLALSIALACLAASRGGESRFLMIDEPKHLDAAGTAALARVVEGLTQFDLRYLISHMPDLRDAFDQSILVVTGDDGLSRIAA